VGNGNLLLGEQRAHFALWALMKSPLLIGADLRSISPDSLAILKAGEVIAINQDELGVAGDLVWMQGANRVSWWGVSHTLCCVDKPSFR
jgi:alpha-galactosidase